MRALTATSALDTMAKAEPLPDRCVAAVSTPFLRYGIAS
jgi:hypothetical protein